MYHSAQYFFGDRAKIPPPKIAAFTEYAYICIALIKATRQNHYEKIPISIRGAGAVRRHIRPKHAGDGLSQER